jgi:hypothetical protein
VLRFLDRTRALTQSISYHHPRKTELDHFHHHPTRCTHRNPHRHATRYVTSKQAKLVSKEPPKLEAKIPEDFQTPNKAKVGRQRCCMPSLHAAPSDFCRAAHMHYVLRVCVCLTCVCVSNLSSVVDRETGSHFTMSMRSGIGTPCYLLWV